MANRHKGEATLVAGSASYTVRFSINAIAEMETLLDIGFNELSAKLSDRDDLRVVLWRAVLWATLRAGGHKVSLEEAGDILDEAGLGNAMAVLSIAMQRSNPDASENPPPAGDAPPAGRTS